MSDVGELILKYSLVDDYSGKAKKVKQSADDLKTSLKDVGSAAHKVGDDLEGAFKQALGALTAVGAGIVAIGAYSLKAFVAYDSIKRSIIGLSGSAEQGAKNMKVLNDLVLKTNFERMQIAPVAQTLAAFGADIEKFLPLAAEIGEAFGNDTEKMQEFAEMIGRIKSGDFGRPFGPEGLGRFGITRQLLEGQGLKFDKQGSFKGSVEDALNAVANIVHIKFDAIAKAAEGSPMARLSNFFDKLNDGAIQLGAAIADKILPHMDKLMTWLGDIVGSGVLTKIVKSFVDLFGVSGKNFNDTLYNLKEFIMRLPDTISKLKPYIDDLKSAVKFVADHWKALLATVIAFKTLTLAGDVYKLVKAIYDFTVAVKAAQAAAAVSNAVSGIATGAGAAGTGVGAAATGVGLGIAGLYAAIAAGVAFVGYEIYSIFHDRIQANKIYDDVSKPILTPEDFKAMRQRADERKAKIAAAVSDKADQDKKAEAARKRQNALDQIVASTRNIAQNTRTSLDLQTFSGGGGNIARFAYTPADASNFRHGRSHSQMLSDYASSKSNSLEAWMAGLIHEAIAQSVREGYLVPR